MSDYPTIKAAEVQPGDTVQWTRTEAGIVMKSIMEVAETATVADAVTSTDGFLVMKAVGGGERSFNQGDPVALMHRSAPELPTKPGSLVYVEAFDGAEIDPPILAFLHVHGYWTGEKFFPNGFGFCSPPDITEWYAATVTKAEL